MAGDQQQLFILWGEEVTKILSSSGCPLFIIVRWLLKQKLQNKQVNSVLRVTSQTLALKFSIQSTKEKAFT